MTQKLVPTYALPEAKKNWRQGVDRVKVFMKEVEYAPDDEFGTPVMRPRFFVDHSCKKLIYEINNYRAAPEPRTGADPQDKPFKRDDHAIDAIRYALVHLYDLGCGRHLDEIYDINTAIGSSFRDRELTQTHERPTETFIGAHSGGETIFSFEDVVF